MIGLLPSQIPILNFIFYFLGQVFAGSVLNQQIAFEGTEKYPLSVRLSVRQLIFCALVRDPYGPVIITSVFTQQ